MCILKFHPKKLLGSSPNSKWDIHLEEQTYGFESIVLDLENQSSACSTMPCQKVGLYRINFTVSIFWLICVKVTITLDFCF